MVTSSGHFSLFENVRISLENFDVQHVLHAAWIPSLGMLLEMLLGTLVVEQSKMPSVDRRFSQRLYYKLCTTRDA